MVANAIYYLEYGEWESSLCDSFLSVSNGAALQANMDVMQPYGWNYMELKLNVYLIEDGFVNFTYQKKTNEEWFLNNGKFFFKVGFTTIMVDDDPNIDEVQTVSFPLKQGFNELTWSYLVNAYYDIDELFAEITVLEFSNIINRE